jgi:hypothetical protein
MTNFLKINSCLMKNAGVMFSLFLIFGTFSFAQVGINSDNSDPDPSAMLSVKSTTKGLLFPRMTTSERNSIVTPTEGLVIYNTIDKIFNVFNGTFWTDMMGSMVLDQPYQGGIIFYIDGTGLHGLIAATADQSTTVSWGCNGTTIGGTSTAIGKGQANTTTIVNSCSTAGIAARICNDLVLNGYDDWFLPSKDELNLMYVQQTTIGGFTGPFYWSSSEYNSSHAWGQNFINGLPKSNNKSDVDYVRAVRAF